MIIKNTNGDHNRIIGAFETVEFPDFNTGPLTAKIDTGAYTGAMHCSSIEVKRVDGGKVLVFSPFDSGKLITKDNFVIKYVKSSNGDREKRFFVTTKMVLKGELHDITLSLADRSDMKWPVLIGRRFLRQQSFLVDPTQINSYREQA